MSTLGYELPYSYHDLTGTATGPFTCQFTCGAITDLVVTYEPGDGGMARVLVRDVDFTLSGNGATGDGYNVTLSGLVGGLAAWGDGDRLLLMRETEERQGFDFSDTLGLKPALVKEAMDRATRIAQEHGRDLSRALRVPVGETAPTLPPVAQRAMKNVAFDGAGNLVAVDETAALGKTGDVSVEWFVQPGETLMKDYDFGQAVPPGCDAAVIVQRAIDFCAVLGGGVVTIPAGVNAPLVDGVRLRSNVLLNVEYGARLFCKGEKAVYVPEGEYIENHGVIGGGKWEYDGLYHPMDRLLDLRADAYGTYDITFGVWYSGIIWYRQPDFTPGGGVLAHNSVFNTMKMQGEYARVGMWTEGKGTLQTKVKCNAPTGSFTTTFNVKWPGDLEVYRLNWSTGWYERLERGTDYEISAGAAGVTGPATVATTEDYSGGDVIVMRPSMVGATNCPCSNDNITFNCLQFNVGWYGVYWTDAQRLDGSIGCSSHGDLTVDITGTVSIQAGGTALVGTGTSFLTSLRPAGARATRVVINGRVHKLKAVADDTHATITADFPFAETVAGAACSVRYFAFDVFQTPRDVWLNPVGTRDAHVAISRFDKDMVLTMSSNVLNKLTPVALDFGPGARAMSGGCYIDYYWAAVSDAEAGTNGGTFHALKVRDTEFFSLTGTITLEAGSTTIHGVGTKFTEELQTASGQLDLIRYLSPTLGSRRYAVGNVISDTELTVSGLATMTGTLAGVSGETTLTGLASDFSGQLAPGRRVIVDGHTVVIDTVLDNTHATVTEPLVSTFAGATGQVIYNDPFGEDYSGPARRQSQGSAVNCSIRVARTGFGPYEQATDWVRKASDTATFKATIPANYATAQFEYPHDLARVPRLHEIQTTLLTPNGGMPVQIVGSSSTGFQARYAGLPNTTPVSFSVAVKLGDHFEDSAPEMTGQGIAGVVYLGAYGTPQAINASRAITADDFNRFNLCAPSADIVLTLQSNPTPPYPSQGELLIRQTGGAGSVTVRGENDSVVIRYAGTVTVDGLSRQSVDLPGSNQTLRMVRTGTTIYEADTTVVGISQEDAAAAVASMEGLRDETQAARDEVSGTITAVADLTARTAGLNMADDEEYMVNKPISFQDPSGRDIFAYNAETNTFEFGAGISFGGDMLMRLHESGVMEILKGLVLGGALTVSFEEAVYDFALQDEAGNVAFGILDGVPVVGIAGQGAGATSSAPPSSGREIARMAAISATHMWDKVQMPSYACPAGTHIVGPGRNGFLYKTSATGCMFDVSRLVERVPIYILLKHNSSGLYIPDTFYDGAVEAFDPWFDVEDIAGTLPAFVGTGAYSARSFASGGGNQVMRSTGVETLLKVEMVDGRVSYKSQYDGVTMAAATSGAAIAYDYAVLQCGQSQRQIVNVQGRIGAIHDGLRGQVVRSGESWVSPAIFDYIRHLDGATGGTAVLKASTNADNWWIDEGATGAGRWGAPMRKFIRAILEHFNVHGVGCPIRLLDWAQGESEMYALRAGLNGVNKARYKAGVLEILTTARELCFYLWGERPPVLCGILGAWDTPGVQLQARGGTGVRLSEVELVAENDWFHHGVEQYSEHHVWNYVHLSNGGSNDDGYAGSRHYAEIIYDHSYDHGPYIAPVGGGAGAPVLSDDKKSVTLTVKSDSGSAIQMCAQPSGFVIFPSEGDFVSTPVPILKATGSGNTVTLQTGQNLTGCEPFFNAGLWVDQNLDVIIEDSQHPGVPTGLPLRTSRIGVLS